uniref:Uncharacterized protein n=1 Tax=Rhizophora mucronata TaxID=61149 RepID=A0A2P2P8H0_RHIMU
MLTCHVNRFVFCIQTYWRRGVASGMLLSLTFIPNLLDFLFFHCPLHP